MDSKVRQAGIAQAALGYAITALGACLVLLAGDFGVPPAELAWLPATFGFGLLVMAPAGPLLLRNGPRPALTGGALAVAAGATLLALAPVPAVAVAGALLLGAGGAAFALVTPALLAGAEAAVQLTKVNAASSSAAVLAPAAIGGLNATGLVNGRLALLLVVPPLLYLAATVRPTESWPTPGARAARPARRAGSAEARPSTDPNAHPGPGAATRPTADPDAQPTAHPDARPAADPDARPTADPATRPAAGVVARRWAAVVLAVSVEFCFTIWAVARLAAAGLAPGTAAALGTAFPIGMALGRLAGPALIGRIPVVPIGAAITGAGALVVVAAGGPAAITAGLVVAGVGVATLYPVALAGLVATPRLRATHAASLGALASGTAILAAPAALARLADVVDLRVAFLITLPLLAALLVVRHRQ